MSGGPAYEIPDPVPWSAWAGPTLRATEALARFDERVGATPLREGVLARLDYRESVAVLWMGRELVHLDDLLLLDAGMSVRVATRELGEAAEILRARRLITREGAAWALSAAGIDTLRNRVAIDPAGEGSFRGDDLEAEAAAWLRWRRVVRESEGLPAVLAAALAYDAWQSIAPFARDAWLAVPLMAAVLQLRGGARHHLPALASGFRAMDAVRWEPKPQEARVVRILEAMHGAAEQAAGELHRLQVAHDMLVRKVRRDSPKGRTSSHILALIDLFVRSPVVSAPLAAKQLRISRQATYGLMARLHGQIQELTDRRRYRAWTIG